LVGSHNWSNAGNDKNDENTLIFHDNQVLANTYLQAFSYRFNEAQHVGFADVDFAQAVSCYPNPSQGQLTLDITTEKAMDLNIQIYDLTGRVVLSENAQAHIGNNQIRINASQLASGTYVLQAKSQGKQYVSTLIIQ
jgi:hypothetical protein